MSSIKKTGVIESSMFTEAFASKYDMDLHVEPDNSVWVRVFHHNNPANARFASTNTFTSSVYLDADRWFNISIANLITNNTYELMIHQLPTSDGTLEKYRWVQTKNPMTCAFGDVDVADVTIVSTSGYTVLSNYGGIYYKNSSTYLCVNNANSGNWMGAVGSWTAWSGGIPGWGKAVTTGYLDLYLRVDNQKASLCSIFDTHIQAVEFIEI